MSDIATQPTLTVCADLDGFAIVCDDVVVATAPNVLAAEAKWFELRAARAMALENLRFTLSQKPSQEA